MKPLNGRSRLVLTGVVAITCLVIGALMPRVAVAAGEGLASALGNSTVRS